MPKRAAVKAEVAVTQGVLGSVELLIAIDKTGSATRAARILGITAATALRKLDALEARVGARLFDRTARGLRPTQAMALVRPWAEQAEAAAAGMLREVDRTERKPAGRVRLAVPPVISTLFIVPALSAFRERFPEIVIELAPATAVVDLAMREADLAIRTVRPERGDLVAQRLGVVEVHVARAPSLRIGSRTKDVRELPWLGWDRSMAHTPEARWIDHHIPAERVVFRSSELGALVAAAQAGLGVTLVADAVMRRAGGLTAVSLPAPPVPGGEVWLVAHSALRNVPRVAAVWSWIIESFTEGAKKTRR